MKADNINVRYLNRAGWGSAFIPGQVFFYYLKSKQRGYRLGLGNLFV